MTDAGVYDFAYLDKETAADYLGGLKGGLMVPVRKKTGGTGKRGIKGAVSAGPVELGGEFGRSGVEETEFIVQESRAGEFYKLRDELAGRKALRLMETFDEAAWPELKEGEFVEIRGRVEVSPLDSFLDLATSLYELGTKFGAIDAKDESTKKAVDMISLLAGSDARGISVFVYPAGAGSVRYRFFTSLKKSDMLVPMDDLNARFRVLGRIRTVLERNESVDLLRLPGSVHLPRREFRKFVRGFSEAPFLDRQIRLSDLKVTAPGIEITTVAIFR